ncbi:S-layer homology domain-containing protein [Calothrix sp. PCC 7507]|uniref:S-layer homology domain-containing protein n=1 Tax=Calothrix sp. PCC 7507 TaxID=99598 RepID=UPI00029F1790|nr:S-layer homology domain-containing protein [Calothrix sp. PCC 7507]AFY33492.1 S-layer domain-containing protein [Calothrix sp. PCC 7507]
MTNTPPPDPKSSQTTALGFDEFIAILVAFSTIGVILFWSFTRRDSGWNLSLTPSPSPVSSASVEPNSSLSSPTPSVELNTGSNLNTLPSPPSAPVVEPSTTPTVIEQAIPAPTLPSSNTGITDSSQILTPLQPSANAIKQPFSLVTPSEKKSTIPPPIDFTDVPADFWSRRFINVLSSRGIIKGFPDYSFRPNQSVNRAEFAAILQQAFENKLETSAIAFNDVKAKYWATPAINQAVSTGFLKGYPNKTFQPEQKILRVQALVALVTGLNLKTPTSPNQILNIYKDAKDIPQYATDKIAAATVNGLVVNHPDTKIFAPNKEATRAEVAVMIHQALVRTGRLEKIPSQNIVRSPQ